MLFKLANNNVAKSVKDFSIYFITLVFGVCIFYTFNSIDAQESIISVTSGQHEILKAITSIMGYVSVFVSIILGFLIVYSNNFLIKRRKKELGIYLTLGMEKRHITKILMIETVSIASIALVCGLILGVFLSQLMSVFTAKIFEADLSNFKFVFSQGAFLKSIMYFGIIFLIVMLFNTITISRYKLIDLLYARKKNETLKIKSVKVAVVVFILSIVTLASSYYLIITNGMIRINALFGASIVLGIIGTLLFFLSLSGFLLKLVQSNKKMYFKDLNMFVLRQINSKINSSFVLMSVVCITLLLAIGTFSTGVSISSALSEELKENTIYDLSMIKYYDKEKYEEIIPQVIEKTNLDKYALEINELNIYEDELLNEELFKLDVANDMEYFLGSPLEFIKHSDVEKLLKAQGKESVTLNDDEYIVLSNLDVLKSQVDEIVENKKVITVSGKELRISGKLENVTMETAMSVVNSMYVLIVLPDDVITNMQVNRTIINVIYKDASKYEEYENKLRDFLYSDLNVNKSNEMLINYYNSKVEIYEESVGVKAVVSFLGIYLGLVFIVTCAAILSLWQLSEASDNKIRYDLLKKLGADRSMINKALFRQIFIIFAMPMMLAIIHSYVGLSVVNGHIRIFGKLDIAKSILSTSIFIIVIYGVYFLATYMGSKNIINSK